MQHAARTSLFHYDAVNRRLWIRGQRCHHGATGAILTGVATAAFLARRLHPRVDTVALATAGSLLMVHDWHDRSIWFERGWQSQP